MGALSVHHWLIVLFVVVLVFGPKRLASAGKGLGDGLRELRNSLREEHAEKSEVKDRLED